MKFPRAFLLSPLVLLAAVNVNAQSGIPPWDIWTPAVLAEIKDQKTLDLVVESKSGYADVTFTSNAAANWFDAKAPYAEHRGEKIRIHAFLASPGAGGPYPALVIGHGHGGSADLLTARFAAQQGYVALYIDGPGAGQSTGPSDDNQAWISVDKGPDYGYLYHYAYAGMRALTVLEALAGSGGNPYRIDTTRLGVFGASMGGMFTTYINAVDDRVKAAIIMASAGSLPHTLRYPNSWLYEGIYNGTRDKPYNGSDPLNSIEDIDSDPTAITFLNYFDPLRYATRQRAPVLTLMGTHDQYFPLPNANIMLQAITSAGARENFEKRLWLLPDKPHAFADSALDLYGLLGGITGWLDYAFGRRERPLATPQVAMTESFDGLRFEITLQEPGARLTGAKATLYAATRIDSTVQPIHDFNSYDATSATNGFTARIPGGTKAPSGDVYRADNVIYYTTVTDSKGLQVSSMVYKGSIPIDLSTDFVPKIDARSSSVVPLPPPLKDAAVSTSSSQPVTADRAYQGIALTNPTDKAMAVRVEARDSAGRIAAGEGLLNPIYLSLPPLAQSVFLAEQRFGPGARKFTGSFRAGWSDSRTGSLWFRGNVGPSELESIGPVGPASTGLWLPLLPDQEPSATRRVLIFGGDSDANLQLTFRNRAGEQLLQSQVKVAAGATVEVPVAAPSGNDSLDAASIELTSIPAVACRLEVSGKRDSWSVEARPVPPGNRYVQPHTEWNGLFTTRLVFVNPSGTKRTVSPTLRTPQGVEIASATPFTLNGYETRTLSVEALFQIGSGTAAGWVDIESSSPIVVQALAFDAKGGAAAASPVAAAGTGIWSMPFYVESAGYWTGLAIANPGTSAVQLTITAYDPTGTRLGSAKLPLEGRQSLTQLVGQWIPTLPAGTTGHIVISSTGPVQLLAYFGTNDGASMAAVPFQPF